MSSSFWWFASRTDGTPIGGHLEESPRRDAPSKVCDGPAPTFRSSTCAAPEEAFDYDGLSLIHVPVCYGEDTRGGMGAYRHGALPGFSANS